MSASATKPALAGAGLGNYDQAGKRIDTQKIPTLTTKFKEHVKQFASWRYLSSYAAPLATPTSGSNSPR
jgi:hypothetical protein